MRRIIYLGGPKDGLSFVSTRPVRLIRPCVRSALFRGLYRLAGSGLYGPIRYEFAGYVPYGRSHERA